MTDRAQLKELLQVSDVQYNHQRQALEKITQEESKLRQELMRLSAMNETPEAEDDPRASMRTVGADLLWQGWLSRAKTEVNMHLARVLAAKAHEQTKVRRAFGKVSALREILKEEEAKHRKKLAKAELEKAVTHSLRARL